MRIVSGVLAAILASSLATASVAAEVKSFSGGKIVGATQGTRGSQAVQADFANAKPMPLPQASAPAEVLFGNAAASSTGTPTTVPGTEGTGKERMITLPMAKKKTGSSSTQSTEDTGVAPQDYGTGNQVYTTARVDPSSNWTAKFYPYRVTGKLYFQIGSDWYVCSASLIKKGLLVTAAHCVSDYGASTFYTNWQFVPALKNSYAPFGTWYGATAYVLTSYYNGSDGCYQYGVICPNDVAVITITPQSGVYPGTSVGGYGVGTNGAGFNGSNRALITQLGYPASLDSGLQMERTDSEGYKYSTYSNNTIIGSAMTGGSSGGPWLVNLGLAPTGIVAGSYSTRNVVVGVTSWGYVSTSVQQQGASPFTSTNITALTTTACTATPAAC